MERWRFSQKNLNLGTGGQDLSLGQFVLYRMRFICPMALAGAWAEFGGLTAQINNLSHVIEMSITDRPWISITCDYSRAG